MRHVSFLRPMWRAFIASSLALWLGVVGASLVRADSGVSDDRVSLPEGPGSTEGIGENVSVDPNMGLMRHSVAISLPAGFPATTPAVGLNYTSGGGSSVLGVGWNMTVPNIERMTSRGVPRYTEADLFAVGGGEELVRISPEAHDADEPAVYRARFEGAFVRYQWHERAGGSGGYWEAQYGDGSVGWFGATADGTVVTEAIEAGDDGTFRYHLVEKIDVYGHRLTYSYLKDGFRSLPSRIDYVFTQGVPTYTVEFGYQPRQDWVSDAKPGYEELLTQRLTQVDVSARGQRLRRYLLDYEDYEQADGRSRLQAVRMLGVSDEPFPIVQRFGYSRAFGAQCTQADCGVPLLVQMVGNEGLGVSLQSGKATLLDIDGDALPDLLDTADTSSQHRFFINRLSSDGSHTFEASPVTSALGTPTAFPLDSPRVQALDINGDGFTDLVNGVSGQVLINKGEGDWAGLEALDALSGYPAVGNDVELRFMDFDNDMRIDLLRSNTEGSSVYRNTGVLGFVEEPITPIGIAFSAGIEFTDMNGDGLLDIAQKLPNQLRYRLNLGRGAFADWVSLPTPLDAGQTALAMLDDLNGDGYTDISVASGAQLTYLLNRFGTGFDPPVTVTDIGGTALPERQLDTLVLTADMNGNGSVDVVWIGGSGGVTYLDLFPRRPHLLTRITNDLGKVTDITYQPSVEQRAAARERGEPWEFALPHPMVVVSEVDEYDDLSDLHFVQRFEYQNGFYDGVERQFRGYARVKIVAEGDANQEEGLTTSAYDVGRVEPHRNGSLVAQSKASGGRTISQLSMLYGDEDACAVAQVPSPDVLIASGKKAVRFNCMVEQETEVQEGLDEERWVTTRSSSKYNGYGNVIQSTEHGIVAVGGGGCKPCGSDADEVFGEACGASCRGDELTTETEFIEPGPDTDDRWILGRPKRTIRYGRPGASLVAETLTYYDGQAYLGLPLGQLTFGTPTRRERKVEDGRYIQSLRRELDGHGNAIATLDPNGEVGGQTHRREHTYDDDGLRVVRTEVLLEDADGSAYRLRRDYTYESLFDKLVSATKWIRVVDGEPQSSLDPDGFTYDNFGRVSTIIRTGDSSASPSAVVTYELGNPISRTIVRSRSQKDGPLDMETIHCVDGRGRTYQERTRIGEGRYQVNGFTVFNLQSKPFRSYQRFSSTTAECDTEEPTAVAYQTFRYDALGRRLAVIQPDAGRYGTASQLTSRYEPFTAIASDEEDNDGASPHANTPTTKRSNGLGHLVEVSRALTAVRSEVTKLSYDGLGRLNRVIDAAGNEKTQAFDLIDRLVSVNDPNSGLTTVTHDDASNVVSQTDARGLTTVTTYDGANRKLERFQKGARDTTLISRTWDISPDCEPGLCTNTAGNLASITYPGGMDTFGFDQRRRAIYGARSVSGTRYEIRRNYDNANRAVAVTYPDGRTLTQVYDDASRLVAVPGVIEAITYTEAQDRGSITFANGTVDRFDYDARRRLSGVTTETADRVLRALTLTRDRSNNIVAIDDGVQADGHSRQATYSYDAWYRLTEREDSEPAGFGYDAIDNLTVSIAGIEQSYTGERPNAVSTMGATALAYDDAGCVTTDESGGQHEWDFMGRLVQSSGFSTATYTFGAGQTRVAADRDGSITHYISGDFEVRDGIATTYVREGRHKFARLESTSFATTVLSDVAPLGAPDGQINAADAWAVASGEQTGSAVDKLLFSSARRALVDARSTTTYLHADHLGSLTLATDDSGGEVGRRSFDTHGGVRATTGFVDRYGFTGQEHEPDSGLVSFTYRTLSPRTGRWLSPDPLFKTVGVSAFAAGGEATAGYAYAGNNPTTLVDPNGLCAVCTKVKQKVGQAANKVMAAYHGARTWKNPRYGARLALKRRVTANARTRGVKMKDLLYYYRDAAIVGLVLNNNRGQAALLASAGAPGGFPEGYYASKIPPWSTKVTQAQMSEGFYGDWGLQGNNGSVSNFVAFVNDGSWQVAKGGGIAPRRTGGYVARRMLHYVSPLPVGIERPAYMAITVVDSGQNLVPEPTAPQWQARQQ